jgi:hypothetical protein
MNNDKQWLIPLTGLAFVIVGVAGFMVAGDVPDPKDDPARTIVSYYSDHKDVVDIGAILATVSGGLFVFFGAHLRQLLRTAQPDTQGDFLPLVAFAGTVIFAAGFALDGSLSFALAETAGEISPSATQALSAFYANDFLVFSFGLQLMLLATGIAVVRNGALPKWTGWVAILLAIVALTPIGFVSFIGGALGVAAISIMLAVRARRRGAPVPAHA